jgi:hypothetical protein
MASVPNNRVTNEAQQNTPDAAKMISHLPILQIIAGANIDRHAMIAAAMSTLFANEYVTTVPAGG